MSPVQLSPSVPIGVVPHVPGRRAFPTPSLRYPDPFLMLDHIGPKVVPPSFAIGGSPHPHRGFETVTLLFSGAMEHADSLGNRFWMHSGAVQVMNAGAGLQHGGGMKADPGEAEFHEIQLWVNVPARQKLVPPTVETHPAASIPTVDLAGGRVRVISGEVFGVVGPARTTQPVQIVHGVVGAGHPLEVPTPEGYHAMLYVLRGSVELDGQTATAGTTVVAEPGAPVSLHSADGAEVLALAGLPIREPVAMGGPFVMNTRAEIHQAFADYDAGVFGTVDP